ncbi:hypothetical protein PHAVU_008G268500 [Phaseolus vulgaris]|uniref:LOB domain-containing protein n=1 Tax=Phaseolus vulgaris TaxID=3885 RepID=V7B903_PHAVU|nr:hypothetical protein PHAVU_008G268500g [Phaseolus vulgaris]ESW14289.1 hypothetical protein PHAVU_008G268500g [Phaseolus vulgaris]
MISGRCAACKNQRRRCPSDCIFSPHFPANDPQRFASVHKIYGGSNVGKMLQQIPPYLREQTANSLYFEAQCRIQDPVYGCVGIISKLYEEIRNTETELAQIQTQITCHKLKVVQANNNAETNMNLLSTVGTGTNFQIPAPSTNPTEFQWPNQVPWFH